MRSLAIFILLMAGCSVGTKPSSDSWLSSKGSIAQKWQMFAAQNPSDFMTRCVAPMMDYPPSNGRYLESHESQKLLLQYMLDDCYQQAVNNRSRADYSNIKVSHLYSWGFRLFFGKFSNQEKKWMLSGLSGSGNNLARDLQALEKISKIWAADGHSDSAFMLAALFLTKDPDASFVLTKQAAVDGNCFAQAHLAFLYAAGIGVKPSPVDAYFWAFIAGRRNEDIHSHAYTREWQYPSASNFYPKPLKNWFDENYGKSSLSALDTEQRLGEAIRLRGDYFCRLPQFYRPLPSSISSAVERVSNQWLEGQVPPDALRVLSAQYQKEAFARESLAKQAQPIPLNRDENKSELTESFQRLNLDLKVPSTEPLAPDVLFASVSDSVFPVYSAISKSSMSRGRASSGSAVHVSDNNFLTNCHIFEGNSFHLLRVEDEFLELTLTATDFERDICIFTVDNDLNLPSISVKSSSDLRVGEPVYAIGNPSGLRRTLSNGLVSAKRQINSVNVIQTNTEISGGSSGGALFDQFGNLVGITSFGLDGREGLNFAIAVEEFLEIP